ncbi:ras GEF [Tilletiaria anomala UBC 951]|uniref:Ras GEF n=1 Tax=Tilletiaria anomala (strain ATCC 24038 / CBS 436.72 / UBC 951) TaxID=1037660 RepID=A0A066VEL0_TILAU|nr:ras GEF [Tilletiaria anomala UBC 951]KDN39851.1 ras GEF [Tilletiaria anomala UBC 951]
MKPLEAVTGGSLASAKDEATDVPEDFAPLETTNFNAVKALIAKYELEIDPSVTREQAEAIGDLGSGTPFVIRAQKLEGGRAVWKVTKRVTDTDLATMHHDGMSTSSLSSGSQFEDNDGNPLQSGDVLGAVLGTHPCFPSLKPPVLVGKTGSTSRLRLSAPVRDDQQAINGPPFGPSVQFHPFSRGDWKRTRRLSCASASAPSLSDADAADSSGLEGPNAFDLLQSHDAIVDEAASLEDTGARSSKDSQSSSSYSRKRRRRASFSNDPRYAIWGAPCHPNRRAVVQTSGPGAPVPLESIDPASSGNGPVKSISCFSASMQHHPIVKGSLTKEEADAIPPLRDYQMAAIFPKDHAALLAASLERVIVQLTSVIDTRLHIDFFYTYRSFTTSHTLLDLLIERFNWSLELIVSFRDAHVQSVVRVRTYVVLKFWLIHFFEEDFLPDRQLRNRLTTWLNSFGDLSSRNVAEAGVISSLRKTVVKLKHLYSQSGVSGLLGQGDDQFRQGGISQPTMAASSSSGSLSESEVDLERLSDPLTVARERKGTREVFSTFNGAPAKALDAMSHGRNSSTQGAGFGSISRALNSTVHKIQKMRMIAQRRETAMSSAATTSSDAVPNDTGDLLFIKGGLESFIDFFQLPAGEKDAGDYSASSSSTAGDAHTPSLDSVSEAAESTPATSVDLPRQSNEATVEETHGHTQDWESGPSDVCKDMRSSESSEAVPNMACTKVGADNLHHTTSEQTLRSPTRRLRLAASSSSTSLRKQQGPSLVGHSTSPFPGIVQIDDVDLSSDEDDDAVRKALRRLPGARDLRTARRAFGSVQSKLLASDSVGDAPWSSPPEQLAAEGDPPFNSQGQQKFGYLTTELFDPDEALAGYELIKGFNLDGFESDEDEPGDAEAALRKLEGYIDEGKVKARARKVEALWQNSRASKAKHHSSEPGAVTEAAVEDVPAAIVPPSSGKDSFVPPHESNERSSSLPMRSSEDAQAQKGNQLEEPGLDKRFATSQFGSWSLPPVHRSFLLDCRSEDIAGQMSLIEAELFSHITWQELASGRWQSFRQRCEISDWEEYYRIRMREKAEAEEAQATWDEDNIGVIVARFNLAANWVASEVVLTQNLIERAAVISKFIRVAWKCYQVANFASMTQIVFGLQSPWVERLHRTWTRIPPWEMRILRDLRTLTSPTRNFRHMRRVVDVMISEEGMEEIVNSAGPPDVFSMSTSGQFPSHSTAFKGCVPFCGLLLMDLMENQILPTCLPAHALDPAADYGATPAQHLEEDLPPLPPQLPVKPLVNVLKFRVLGMIIKTVIAFQERSKSYDFTASGPLYLRCLKLRCLSAPLMTQLSRMAEP